MCCLSSTWLRCQILSLWDGKWKHDLFSCLWIHCWQHQACVWPETAPSSWWPFLDVSSLLTARQVEADNCKVGNTAPVCCPFSLSLCSCVQITAVPGLTLLHTPVGTAKDVLVCGLPACGAVTVERHNVQKQCGVLASSESIKKTCPWGNALSSLCGPLCLIRAIGLNLIRISSSSVLYGQNF